jgi:hypothetical protein
LRDKDSAEILLGTDDRGLNERNAMGLDLSERHELVMQSEIRNMSIDFFNHFRA